MIYPDIEMFRRDSDSLEDIVDFRRYQLEKNCSEIFAKGPALTKDFLVKVNSDIVPKKTYLLGYELKTKKILFISGLFLLFFTSLFGATIMWLTDFFDNSVLSTMVISNSSKYFNMWSEPSATFLVRVHIFNYTNLETFEKKFDKKLKVEDVGPYVYEESLRRVNIKFSDDGKTVSYQIKKSYKFRPDLSNGRQSDQVTVPNIPVLASSSMFKYHNYFLRIGLSGFINALGEKSFITLPADSFIIGYNNKLLDYFTQFQKIQDSQSHMVEKVGILTTQIGVQPHVYTMNTGKDDIDNMRLIEKLDGENQLNYWSTEECNKISGSDGALYPPKLVQRKQPLNFVATQACRNFPLVFQKEENILNDKIPSYKYVIPEYVYDSPDEKPDNQCYCSLTSGDCPLKGVFNITPCSFGVPLFISHPHFYRADETLSNGVDGLKSMEKEEVESSFNIHPTMGFVMSGKGVLQLNIQVNKAYGMSQMDKFEEGQMLPLAWLNEEISDRNLPKDVLDLIYESTFTLKGVKMAFQYGFLLTTLITLICIVLVLKSNWQKSEALVINTRNIQTDMPQASSSMEV